jgi:ankyrin repeat protein
MAHVDGNTGRAAPHPEPPFTFLDMPCDLLSCLGPVASTPGYAREMDGTQRLCRTARDDTMLGAATANLRYKLRWGVPRSRLAYACRVNDEARVAWLVECGARDVLACTEEGYTGGAALLQRLAGDPLVDATAALVAAAAVGMADLVAPLVARGAQLERVCVMRYTTERFSVAKLTALQAAAERGHLEVVAALVAAGAAVNATQLFGTALMRAASCGELQAAQALVAAGADVNLRSVNGSSAAVLACSERGAPVAAYLCALPQAEPSAHIAAASMVGDVELVRAFLARGASAREQGKFGHTCLVLAAKRGHHEVVRALLDAGTDVAHVDDPYPSSLYHGADKPAVLALLLERFEVGGDAVRQQHLDDALGRVVGNCTPAGVESVRLLLGAGADVDALVREYDEGIEGGSMSYTSRRFSALSWAVQAGNVAAFRLLLEAGADVRGMKREATPEQEIRRFCRVPEVVPELLAVLAGARGGGAGGGVAAAAGRAAQ